MRSFHAAHNRSLGPADLRCAILEARHVNKTVTGQVHGRYTIKLNDPDEILHLEKL